MRLSTGSLVGVAVMGLLIAMPVAAQRFPQGDGGGFRPRVEAPPSSQELGRAVSRLRDRTSGRVLSAETREQEDGPVHHIRILTREGKVRRFRVDGRDGSLLPRGNRR